MLPAAGHSLEVRGHAVVVDGASLPLSATSMALLRALTAKPGQVVSRAAARPLPGEGGDEHAVEVAIGRLRTALGDARCVQTVVKRGYRLAYDPEAAGECGPAKTPGRDAPRPVTTSSSSSRWFTLAAQPVTQTPSRRPCLGRRYTAQVSRKHSA